MQTKEWKRTYKRAREKVVSITAGDRMLLECAVKVDSVMRKPAETFVNGRNVEKPQASLNEERGTARRLFQKLGERTTRFRQ